MKLSLVFIILISNVFGKEISILGNTKTSNKKIRAIINSDSSMDTSSIRNRLLRTGVFSKISVTDEGNKLKVLVEERWTLIPILKFSSGGGVSQVTAGLFEANLLGEVSELGAQYERLQDTNSVVTWYKNPHLFKNNFGLDLQFWEINRLRTKYDQSFKDPIITNGFLQTRSKLYLGLSKIFSDEIKLVSFYEYNKDRFSNRLVPREALNINSGKPLPANSTVHFSGLRFNYQKLFNEIIYLNGFSIDFDLRYGLSEEDKVSNFQKSDITFKYYKSFKPFIFAQRMMTGTTNTDALQYWNYFGGLESIRGYADNRFAGRYYWLSNSEMRFTFLSRSSFVLQGVGFLDIVGTSEYFNDISNLTAASSGFGIRIILPKIYRFVFRIDYAKPIKKNDKNAFSFGVQQFF